MPDFISGFGVFQIYDFINPQYKKVCRKGTPFYIIAPIMSPPLYNIKRCAEKAHLFILYSGGDMMGACRLLRPCFYIPLELCLSLRVKFSLKRKKRTILNSKNGLWITQKWLQIPF